MMGRNTQSEAFLHGVKRMAVYNNFMDNTKMTDAEKIEWCYSCIERYFEKIQAGTTYEGIDLEKLIMRHYAMIEKLKKPDTLNISVTEEVKANEALGN